MRAWRCGLLGCLLLLGWSPALAQGLDVAALDGQGVGLGPLWSVLRDPEGRRDRSVALAQPFQPSAAHGDAVSLGYTRDTLWLRIRVRNSGQQTQRLVLDVPYPLLEELDVHLPDWQGGWHLVQTGYLRPRADRPIKTGFIAVPFEVPAEAEGELVLRARSVNSLIVPARLWKADDFRAHDRQRLLLQALYFGAVLAIGLYNLVIFLVLRDRHFALYLVFSGSVGLALANFGGIGPEYLWGDWPFWIRQCINVSGSVAAMAVLLFARGMLDTAKRMPRLDQWMRLMGWLNLLIIPLLLLSFRHAAPVWAVLSALSACTLLMAGLRGALQRQVSAYYFVIAFGVLLVAVVAGHLRNLGLVPANVFTTSGIQLGSALDMVLLSLALAERYTRMRRERVQAQAETLAAMRAHEQQLEARVAERTAALEAANQRLEAMSQTDGLTGLANRRHFDTVLEREWARALRNGQPLALGLIDVDWFKAYNDRLGHLAGDDCLRQLAQLLTETLGKRSADLVARFGGEEFVFLMPETDQPEAMRQGERLIAALRERAHPHPASPLGRVSCSVGVAAKVPLRHGRAQELLEVADAALYAAKAGGRDRLAAPDPAHA